MNELLLKIQDACLQLNGWYLAIPGLAAVIMGLFLWLGGARYAFFVVGVLGAMVGSAAGLAVSQWFDLQLPLTVSVGAAVFAIIAILLQQTVILILAALIFALACGMTYMGHNVSQPEFQDQLLQLNQRYTEKALSNQIQNRDTTTLSGDLKAPLPFDWEDQETTEGGLHTQGIQKLKDIFNALFASASDNRNMLFLWAVVGGAGGLFIGFLLKKIIMAFCCSMVGATCVISGMLAMFLAKKIEVFSSLQDRPKLLLSVFVAMVFFGFPLQLFITGRAKKKSKDAEKKEDKK
ncbi:MAG: hypothetical protein GY869_02265 [Planctomycetes bacterium]|nr:hypothetical protein [Planctomycetota bacterium]